jgi:hypothetical protein
LVAVLARDEKMPPPRKINQATELVPTAAIIVANPNKPSPSRGTTVELKY